MYRDWISELMRDAFGMDVEAYSLYKGLESLALRSADRFPQLAFGICDGSHKRPRLNLEKPVGESIRR